MTKPPGFLLEIDGERVEITGVYQSGYNITGVGLVFGEDIDTSTEAKVTWWKANKAVAFVSVYRNNPDGSQWGLRGIFRQGIWAVGENDMPLFKVWDRLA